MILFLSALAHAQEEPPDEELPDETPSGEEAPDEEHPDEEHPDEEHSNEEEPLRTFLLNAEGELESALDHFEDGIEDTEAMPAEIQEMLRGASLLPAGLVAPRLRGRFFLRPTLSYGGLDRSTSGRLGISGGHRWFQITEDGFSLAGETRLSADTPLAGASGSAVSLSTLAGPWIGPVGLRLGPILRYEQARYEDATLDPALLVGGRGILSVEAGSLCPYIGAGLDTIISGQRPGDLEPIALLGLARERGWVRLAGQGSFQQTAQGLRWTVGLGISLTPHLFTEDQ